MAQFALAKKTAPVRRHRRTSPALVKAQAALSRLRKHGRKPAKLDFVGAAMSAGAGLGFALVDAKRPQMSEVKGVPLPLVYGVVATALGTMVHATSKGVLGQALRETGAAGLSLGVYKLASKKLGAVEPTEGDFGEDESAVEGEFEDE